MLTYGVMLFHDNVHPHTAAHTTALLQHFNWELFAHPTYGPDLAPSDYNLFTYLKTWLRSQRFKCNEFMEWVKTWLSSQAADFFDRGI
jgi:transposase